MAERDLLLFPGTARSEVPLGPGAVLLPGGVGDLDEALLAAIADVRAAAPSRQMHTPGGRPMSALLTSCGALGWVSDRAGYRYEPCDPLSGQPWPAMPAVLATLATDAAARAGFTGFKPDSCLINLYTPGARMTLHQDADELDFDAPIVSVSLGLPITFLFGGPTRSDRTRKVPLEHGDVVVWGGPSRRWFHGVLPLADGLHPKTGACRYNLTFRRAGGTWSPNRPARHPDRARR